MNPAYLHLATNHLPVIGLPVALVFLAFALKTKNIATQRFALGVLLVLALTSIPVYLTGEPAEEVVEHLPGISHSVVEAHEDMAKFGFVLTLLTGALAAAALFFRNQQARATLLTRLVLAVGIVAVALLVYTANLGGRIRHDEVRGDAANTPTSAAPTAPVAPSADDPSED